LVHHENSSGYLEKSGPGHHNSLSDNGLAANQQGPSDQEEQNGLSDDGPSAYHQDPSDHHEESGLSNGSPNDNSPSALNHQDPPDKLGHSSASINGLSALNNQDPFNHLEHSSPNKDVPNAVHHQGPSDHHDQNNSIDNGSNAALDQDPSGHHEHTDSTDNGPNTAYHQDSSDHHEHSGLSNGGPSAAHHKDSSDQHDHSDLSNIAKAAGHQDPSDQLEQNSPGNDSLSTAEHQDSSDHHEHKGQEHNSLSENGLNAAYHQDSSDHHEHDSPSNKAPSAVVHQDPPDLREHNGPSNAGPNAVHHQNLSDYHEHNGPSDNGPSAAYQQEPLEAHEYNRQTENQSKQMEDSQTKKKKKNRKKKNKNKKKKKKKDYESQPQEVSITGQVERERYIERRQPDGDTKLTPHVINNNQIDEKGNVDVNKPAAVHTIASKVQETRTQPPLPNILLIGAQQAGTTSISHWLFSNGVCNPEALAGEPSYFEKEVQFFDQDNRYQQGLDFYLRRFAHCKTEGGGNFVMDASPRTLLFPKRVFDTYKRVGTESLSGLKLIVILRDPTSRELSLYNHKKTEYLKNQKNNEWYSDVADANSNTLMSFEEYSRHVLVDRLSNQFWESEGKYIDYLKQWMSFFRREQMLILSYDEVREDPKVAQRRIELFLGVEFMGHLQESDQKTTEAPPMARKVLDPLFEEKNLELYKFLDQHNGPSMEQYPFPRFKSDLATQT